MGILHEQCMNNEYLHENRFKMFGEAMETAFIRTVIFYKYWQKSFQLTLEDKLFIQNYSVNIYDRKNSSFTCTVYL